MAFRAYQERKAAGACSLRMANLHETIAHSAKSLRRCVAMASNGAPPGSSDGVNGERSALMAGELGVPRRLCLQLFAISAAVLLPPWELLLQSFSICRCASANNGALSYRSVSS